MPYDLFDIAQCRKTIANIYGMLSLFKITDKKTAEHFYPKCSAESFPLSFNRTYHYTFYKVFL